jgi:hypothetical protein
MGHMRSGWTNETADPYVAVFGEAYALCAASSRTHRRDVTSVGPARTDRPFYERDNREPGTLRISNRSASVPDALIDALR